jgi:aspartate kinase/aspartokinase/homoserine dehydrogenase 1
MSKKIVVKFGGSNFKSTEDLSHLVNVVKTYNRSLIIVVSAFSGITDKLNEHLQNPGSPDYTVDSLINFLFELKRNAIVQNISDDTLRFETISAVAIRLKELEKLLTAVNLLGVIPDFVTDTVLSYGERLSSLVLTAILKDKQIVCDEILPEEIGLVTDGEYGNATVDFELAEASVKEKLSENKTFIVPGFYGVSVTGKITLFGRGGSDYSAAAIAFCLNAESLDFWKDVDGFQTADPRVVALPESIQKLSYDEAAELAYFGAKILHPRTIEPLINKNIPVRIFNVYKPVDIQNPVTVINANQEVTKTIIKSVTSSHDFGILKLVGSGLGIKKGILARVTSAIDHAGINIKSVITSQTTINLLLSVNDLSRAYQLVESLKISAVSELQKVDDVATIAVVGHGLTDEYGIAAILFSSLAKAGINVKIISLGASSVASYFIINKCDRENAIREIHKEFFQQTNFNKNFKLMSFL